MSTVNWQALEMTNHPIPNGDDDPRLTNYVVPIPGTTATVYLGHYAGTTEWAWSIWAQVEAGWDSEELIASDFLDMTTLNVTPEQVGRIAYLLGVEYAS